MAKRRLFYTQSDQEQAALHVETVKIMALLKTKPNPISYRVVYEHLTKEYPELSEVIQGMIDNSEELTDAVALRLTQDFLTIYEKEDEQNNHSLHRAATDSLQRINTILEHQQSIIAEQRAKLGDFAISKLIKSNSELVNIARNSETEIKAIRHKAMKDRKMAYTDIITQLHNELHLKIVLPELLASGEYIVSLLDMDNFSKFNHEHGHHLADSLLRSCAKIFLAIEQSGKGYSWRSGNDEFLCAIPINKSNNAKETIEMFKSIHEKICSLEFKSKGVKDIKGSMVVIKAKSCFHETYSIAAAKMSLIKNGASLFIQEELQNNA